MAYFDISMRMITHFCHFYIDYEIYAMAYFKNISIPHDTLFIQNTIVKWDDYSTWGKTR